MALESKISRVKSDIAIKPYASEELTLEVGAYGRPSYGRFFPNRIGVDIKEGPGVDTVANVYELPFPDEHFANVLCMSVLEHLEEPSRAITEMRRVLKPGGRMIVSVPFLFPIHDAPGDYWRFTKFGLRRLFSDGWKIEKVCAETTTQETFAVLFQRLGYQTTLRLNKVAKFIVFLLAWCLARMPSIVVRVFGDIHKKFSEPEAFTSAFFLVAKKTSDEKTAASLL